MENNLGILLKKLRKGKHYSLHKVEVLSGVSGCYVWRLERGERTNPAISIIGKLSIIYNTGCFSK